MSAIMSVKRLFILGAGIIPMLPVYGVCSGGGGGGGGGAHYFYRHTLLYILFFFFYEKKERKFSGGTWLKF